MNSRAEGAYLAAVRTFQNPMLDLLHKRHAPLVVAVLSLLFTADRAVVPVAEAHTEVADALDSLRAAGFEDNLPVGTARELCRQWAEAGWLVRQVGDDDVETYRLSAHAVGALEIAGRAGGRRTRVSRSRMRSLLDALDRLAQDADPDVLVRMARLDEQIRDLRAEVERLQRTGQVEQVDDEVLLEEAENVLHLVRELPADFARVAESIKAMQRDVVTALRQDERPTGEVLREYLDRGEHVMDATPEGRAFAGALRLVGDPQRLDELAGQLAVVLRHPFARLLDSDQRAQLRDLVRRLEAGLTQVLTAQREASVVITAQVRHHDPLRDRQVDDLLRDVMTGLSAWLPQTRRGEAADPVRRLPVAATADLRRTLADLAPASGPEALAPWDDDEPTNDDEARAWGGPHYADLAMLLESWADDEADLAELFAAAPQRLRRPVDLVGLLEVGHGLVDRGQVAYAEAVRPDGSRRTYAFEAVALGTRADHPGGDEHE